MIKKSTDIAILGEKVREKDMAKMAQEVLMPNNKMKIMDGDSFVSGNISSDIFSKNTQFYINPTESLRIANYVNEGDNFATVLGSGDFLLDGVYSGVKRIVTFDISKFQYPIALLKTQAIKVLSYDEYFSFFSDIYSADYLSPGIYKKITSASKNPLLFSFWNIFMEERALEKKKLMNDQNYRFFSDARELLQSGTLPYEIRELLISLTGKDGIDAIKTFNDIYYNQVMKNMDNSFNPLKTISAISGEAGEKVPGSYLESRESFELTRERLEHVDVDFLKTDIAKIKFNLLKSGYTKNGFEGFDSIYLSNIPEFFNGETFANILDSQLIPLLKDDGSIVYCCQGVDEEVLRGKGITDFEQARRENLKIKDMGYLLNRVMEINDAEAFSVLSKMYDVSLDVCDKYCEANGNGKTDIYVKVMKK